MSNKMNKVIRLMISTNLTQKEIAKEIDIREETISRWKKEDRFIEQLNKEEARCLKELTAPALRTLKSLLNAESESVRLQAAKDVLDRTGYKPPDKMEIGKQESVIIIDDIGDLPD